MGACGPVDIVSFTPTGGHVLKLRANFSFDTTSIAYPAVMGTWRSRNVTEWLKMPAYLHDVIV